MGVLGRTPGSSRTSRIPSPGRVSGGRCTDALAEPVGAAVRAPGSCQAHRDGERGDAERAVEDGGPDAHGDDPGKVLVVAVGQGPEQHAGPDETEHEAKREQREKAEDCEENHGETFSANGTVGHLWHRTKKKGLSRETQALEFTTFFGAPGRIRTHDPLVRSQLAWEDFLPVNQALG